MASKQREKNILTVIIKVLYYIVLSPFLCIYFCLKPLFLFLERKKLEKYIFNLTIYNIDSLNGYDFEFFVSALLRYCRYKTKITKRSGDYGMDVFAKKNGKNICIQTKLYFKSPVGNKAIQEVHTAKAYFNCDIALLFTNSTYTKSAIQMADKLGIVLIGRKELIKGLSSSKNCEKLIDSWILGEK